jgi:hypothetical protein
MAGTWFGRSESEDPELTTFVVTEADLPHAAALTDSQTAAEDAEHAPAAEPPDDASAGKPAEEPRLALDQMRVTVEGGLLMVFGPEGDPVPPGAFAEAAAERPDAQLDLPDGATVPASRIAAVLRAQTLGRLGAAEHGAEWILPMLRGSRGPEAASDDALRAERARCVLRVVGDQLLVETRADNVRIVDRTSGPAAGEAIGLFLRDGAPISVADLIALIRAQQVSGPLATAEARSAAPSKADPDRAGGQESHATPSASEDPAPDDLVLGGCTIELHPDGLRFDVPGLTAHGAGVRLARWATSPSNGPVVDAFLADGRKASLADLFRFAVADDRAAEKDHQADAGDEVETDEQAPVIATGSPEESSAAAQAVEEASGASAYASSSGEGLDWESLDQAFAAIESSFNSDQAGLDPDLARLDADGPRDLDTAAAHAQAASDDMPVPDDPSDLLVEMPRAEGPLDLDAAAERTHLASDDMPVPDGSADPQIETPSADAPLDLDAAAAHAQPASDVVPVPDDPADPQVEMLRNDGPFDLDAAAAHAQPASDVVPVPDDPADPQVEMPRTDAPLDVDAAAEHAQHASDDMPVPDDPADLRVETPRTDGPFDLDAAAEHPDLASDDMPVLEDPADPQVEMPRADGPLELDAAAEHARHASDDMPIPDDPADPQIEMPAAVAGETDGGADHGLAPDQAHEVVLPAPAETGSISRPAAADESSPTGAAPADSAWGADARESDDVEETAIDPQRMALVVIRGVPEGARLSTGVRDDDGSWSISPVDLSSVTISLAPGSTSDTACGADGDLDITGIAFADGGELVAVTETVPLADYLAVPGSSDPTTAQEAGPAPADNAVTHEAATIPLEIDPRAWAGERFDALVIRDLPAGARLSTGAYDAAIDGWVLMPQDLSALAVLPPPGLRADFTVTLMGIALRPDDADAARVLARLPIKLS